MSENTTETSTQDATPGAPNDVDSPETREQPEPDPRNEEAKRYRLRAKKAERELEDTRAKLLSIQSQVAERQIAETRTGTFLLHDVNDLYLHTGTSATDYLNEDGSPDASKIENALAQLRQDRPYLFTNTVPRPTGMGVSFPSPPPSTSGMSGLSRSLDMRHRTA